MRKATGYTAYESLERKAANAIARKNSSRAPKKTAEELRAFIFGGPNSSVTLEVTKTKPQIVKENCEKYSLIAQGFCSITTADSFHNCRFSKLENSRKQVIDDTSIINVYDCKTREYLNIDLSKVICIAAKGVVVDF